MTSFDEKEVIYREATLTESNRQLQNAKLDRDKQFLPFVRLIYNFVRSHCMLWSSSLQPNTKLYKRVVEMKMWSMNITFAYILDDQYYIGLDGIMDIIFIFKISKLKRHWKTKLITDMKMDMVFSATLKAGIPVCTIHDFDLNTDYQYIYESLKVLYLDTLAKKVYENDTTIATKEVYNF